MKALKIILTILDIIVAFAVVFLVMIQKNDDKGMSSTITGAGASNYLDKNKGKTREGKLKRFTIIFSIIFVILTIILNFIYPLA